MKKFQFLYSTPTDKKYETTSSGKYLYKVPDIYVMYIEINLIYIIQCWYMYVSYWPLISIVITNACIHLFEHFFVVNLLCILSIQFQFCCLDQPSHGFLIHIGENCLDSRHQLTLCDFPWISFFDINGCQLIQQLFSLNNLIMIDFFIDLLTKISKLQK